MARNPKGRMDASPPASDGGASYCKPPMHTRFRPGQSGNPNGRPKGRKNFRTELAEELQERVQITEGGRKREVSKQRALIKSMIAKAAAGEVRVLMMLLDKLVAADLRTETDNDTNDPGDQAILDRYKARLGRSSLPNGGDHD
jgi:hypothetical protein